MKPEELKHLRSKRGWSRDRLARALSVTSSTIVRWEAGSSIPGPAEIALRAILGAVDPVQGQDRESA
jgi:DNA-binding transcriptional regulator YiaG